MLNSEWKEFRLGEILAEKGYIRGPFGSALKRGEMQEKGIPVYEQQHAIYDHREFRYHVNEEKFDEMKRFSVQRNDLIISCSGTIGRVSIIRENDPVGIISQALLILRPNTSIITPDFLYYYFSSHYGFYALTSVSSGSVQVNVANRKIIENTIISLPSISEQKKITEKLRAIDDTISNNQHLKTVANQFISSAFRSWFIDFDPVKAKAGGNLPYGMDEKTASLFPDSFEESELGALPLGWKTGSLSDLSDMFEINPEKTNSSLNNQEINYIDISSVGFGFLKSDPEKIYYHEAPSRARRIVRHGDILISTVRPNRKSLIYIHKPPINTIASTGFAQLRANNRKFGYFLLGLVTNPQFTLELEMVAYGAAYPAVSIKDICSVPFALPPISVIEKFGETVELFVLHSSNSLEHNRTLDEMKSLLLPRLISGELSVL